METGAGNFYKDLAVLQLRVLSDREPARQANALHLVGATLQNQVSVLDAGARLALRDYGACCVLTLPGSEDTSHGYPGFSPWYRALLARGVPAERIVAVDGECWNTYVEMQSLIAYARARAWQSIIITAPPFHQLRAFMSAVSVALVRYPTVKLYSAPGNPLPWEERAIHSQGTLAGTRLDFIGTEIERIRTYQAKGDLVSFEGVHAYLSARDR